MQRGIHISGAGHITRSGATSQLKKRHELTWNEWFLSIAFIRMSVSSFGTEVITCFKSSSSTSTRWQFSSSVGSGSVPFAVTHGCSWNHSRKILAYVRNKTPKSVNPRKNIRKSERNGLEVTLTSGKVILLDGSLSRRRVSRCLRSPLTDGLSGKISASVWILV